MNQTIVILGTGPGLGIALARKYGRLGHTVALVARSPEPLQQWCSQLAAEGITAQAFPTDLRDSHAVAVTLQQIQTHLGHVQTLYYGPNAPEVFVPAASLTVEAARDKVDLFLYGLIAAVGAVLPAMRSRQQGEILIALGGSASGGLPFMSGPGPALAGARNYLQSLHGELASEGIYVGMLTLAAVIRRSGWHAGLQSGAISMDLPPGFQIPEVEPEALADMLYDAAQSRRVAELVYPPMAV